MSTLTSPIPLPMEPVPMPDTSTQTFPFGNLVRYLARKDTKVPHIKKFIGDAMASGGSGLIKGRVGTALKVTCDKTALGELQDRNYNTRLGAMSRLFCYGLHAVLGTEGKYQHVHEFILRSGETIIPIMTSGHVQSSGVPCVAWMTYLDRTAFYANMNDLCGKANESFVLERDNSDETDPLFVGAHIAIGLCQLDMRDNKLIADGYKSFKTLVLYMRSDNLIGCSTALMTEGFLQAVRAKSAMKLDGFQIVYEPTPIAVDSPGFKDLLAHIEELLAAQDGTPKPIEVVRKKRRSTDTVAALQFSGASGSV